MNVFDAVPISFVVRPGQGASDGFAELHLFASSMPGGAGKRREARRVSPMKPRTGSPTRPLPTASPAAGAAGSAAVSGGIVGVAAAGAGAGFSPASTLSVGSGSESAGTAAAGAGAVTEILTPAELMARIERTAEAAERAVLPERVATLAAASPSPSSRFGFRKRRSTVRTMDAKQCSKGMWIVKPSSLNRGTHTKRTLWCGRCAYIVMRVRLH